MKNIVVSFLLMFSYPSIAAWAAFEVITPENIVEQQFTFVVESKDDKEVVLCLSDENVGNNDGFSFLKSAWLVKTLHELGPTELNFEQHFGGVSNNPQIAASYAISSDMRDGSDCQMRIKLDLGEINRSYIFVGYAQPVMDGGLRYTILLSSFVK